MSGLSCGKWKLIWRILPMAETAAKLLQLSFHLLQDRTDTKYSCLVLVQFGIIG